MLPKQAQHVAEAAITARQAVKKARRRAEEAVAESEAAVFNREQLIAAVADLRRAISAQAAEETIAASAQTPHPLQVLDMNNDILDRHGGSCTGQEEKLTPPRDLGAGGRGSHHRQCALCSFPISRFGQYFPSRWYPRSAGRPCPAGQEGPADADRSLQLRHVLCGPGIV